MMIISFFLECAEHWIMNGPSNKIFSELRWKFYRSRLKKGSGYFSSLTGLSIPCPESVFIGNNVSINHSVSINACLGGSIIIGDNCMIGPYVLFRSADHRFNDAELPIRSQGHTRGDIIIEEDCWIAAHVTVTANVKIGKGSVVGANSVVTHDIPPYSIAAGVPARVIKSRHPT